MKLIQSIDNQILQFIQSNLHSTVLDKIMPIITMLGDNGVIWILLAIILIVIKKSRKTGAILLLALLMSVVLGEILLKPLIGRIRPCNINPNIVLLIPKPSGFSFPSNHTMSSFAAATVLLLQKNKLAIIAIILAISIAFSRLYLFVHYPTDILVGAVLGIGIAWISVWLFKDAKGSRKFR